MLCPFIGGGPPPSCSSDSILTKVKTLIGPSLEGLFTMYDGDADFMKEQQSTISIDKQLQPIELEIEGISPQIEIGKVIDKISNVSFC